MFIQVLEIVHDFGNVSLPSIGNIQNSPYYLIFKYTIIFDIIK